MPGQDHYLELLERVTIVETNQKHADEQRGTMLTDIADIKKMLQDKIKQDEVKDARFGGILWAATVMAGCLSTLAKIAWDWFHKGG
jgi:hypothetical protein